jgi:pseudouridine-5'-phosphate glycosidase/sugar/nucleoside kinase (ribokinase family)
MRMLSSRCLPRVASWCRPLSSTTSRLHITPEVQEALRNGVPVVALESTIVAHGMPYPQNLQVAQDVERLLRQNGVVPATIAVKNGIGRIGLSGDELQELAQAGTDALKVSTRELSLLMGSSKTTKIWGATTVASTMKLAHQAGISTFVTGGIGGVHRGGELSMDVSTDLIELSRTPVIVISAGIKSILDIPRTLEMLETLAVPTVTYQADDFPAFFSPTSGVKTPWRADSPEEIARAYLAARDLGLSHGMLVAVPNTDPGGARVEDAIQDALQQAVEQGISGQALTPFILKTVAEQTEGESLRSNISLVMNNAQVGAGIAMAIAEERSSMTGFMNSPRSVVSDTTSSIPSKVVVLGGAVVDIVAKPTKHLIPGTSIPGSCIESDGGVGRNVAEVLGRLGCQPSLYTAVGDDARGRSLMQRFEEVGGIDCSHVIPSNGTATYLALLDANGDLHAAIADMDVFAHMAVPTLEDAEYLVMDANPPISVLKEAAAMADELGVKVCFEPTSVPKARLVANELDLLARMTYAFPNLDELMTMADCITDHDRFVHEDAPQRHLSFEESAAAVVLQHMHPTMACLVVTMGDKGVLLASRAQQGQGQLEFQNFPVQTKVEVLNSTGAGDSLCGAFIAALSYGKSHVEAVNFGMEAAKLSVQATGSAISKELTSLRDKLN